MTSIESAVQEFLLSSEAEGLADSTLRWYQSILKRLTERHPVKPIREFTPHDMRVYLVGLRKAEYAPESVDDHTRALHRFWRWTALEYEVHNPMRSIRYPKQQKRTKPKAVSLETVILMFRATDGGMNVTRDRAILAFTLDSGCRAGGICTLRTEDVDMENRRATVTEKGSKTRTVLFTKVTAALLQDWINERQIGVEVFFYSLQTWEALRPNSLYLLFKRLARRAGVRDRSNPHGWRHTFSIEYLKAGGSLATLSLILGHESVDTTARHYAIFTAQEVAEAHERYSPINLLFKQENQDDRDTQ